MLDDTIYIVVSIDKNFYHHLNVLINSIKFYNKSKIHLFLCISTFKDKEFFSSNLSTFNSLSFSFEIILFQKHDFLDIFAGKKYDHPIECYFRILFGSLLPQRIQKIIYLDADMIVNCDLFELYNTNIATTIGGVVDSVGQNYCKGYIGRDLNITLSHYINAGLLLINLDKWRSKNVETKMMHFLHHNFYHLKMLDQDLINIFFQQDITLLDPKWNHILFHGRVNKNIRNTGIYHLLGAVKGDSLFYANYKIGKKYHFFSGREHDYFYDICRIIIYFFISAPISNFLFLKSKIHYKNNHYTFYDLGSIILLFYPPVLFVLFYQVFYQFKRRGLSGFYLRLKEFFE